MGTSEINAEGNRAMDYHPTQGEEEGLEMFSCKAELLPELIQLVTWPKK